jgi:hypothetical protein
MLRKHITKMPDPMKERLADKLEALAAELRKQAAKSREEATARAMASLAEEGLPPVA